MKVILLQDVKKVGQKGSVVEVKDGYAQNVLLPKKLAVPASAVNIQQHEQDSRRAGERKAIDVALSRGTLAKLDGKIVTIHAKAGETGTLFVALHERDIAEAIQKESGFSIPESAIVLDAPIKKTGDHPIPLTLMEATAVIVVQVTRVEGQ